MSTLYELGQDVKELEGLLDRLEEAGDSEATEEVKEIKATVEKLIPSKSEDRTAIKKAIKDGQEIPGAHLLIEDSLVMPKTKKE